MALCRYKGTIICQEVAKAKNVCQVCPDSKFLLSRLFSVAIKSCKIVRKMHVYGSRMENAAVFKIPRGVQQKHTPSRSPILILRHVQVCLLDLDYNLPVQVRDQALGIEDEALPESDVGREFALERMSNEGELGAAFQKGKPNDTILKLQRTNPYYQVC